MAHRHAALPDDRRLQRPLLLGARSRERPAALRAQRRLRLDSRGGLGAAIVLALVNLAIRHFLKVKHLLGKRGEILTPKHHRFLVLQKKWIVDIHLAAGIVGFLGALLHGYLLWQFRNVWLLVALLLFAWMSVVGLILKFGGLGSRTKKYIYLVHSQWVTVVLLVLATLIGHAGF